MHGWEPVLLLHAAVLTHTAVVHCSLACLYTATATATATHTPHAHITTSTPLPPSRFLINIPVEDREDTIRICFAIEQAHWCVGHASFRPAILCLALK